MRWMSPELFDSEGHQQTKGSDCYALGMVIYEVLSRRTPFYQYKNLAIAGRVIKGERPERPQGPEGVVGFTDAVWEVLELCWKSLPQERPSIEDVLKCMKKAATFWTPPSPMSTTVSSAADSPTLDTSIITREESEDADEGEIPLLSQLSDRFPVPTAVSSATGSPTSDTFVIAREESEDADEGDSRLANTASSSVASTNSRRRNSTSSGYYTDSDSSNPASGIQPPSTAHTAASTVPTSVSRFSVPSYRTSIFPTP
jgi:hypothetical protein